jgi:hypothetical protein
MSKNSISGLARFSISKYMNKQRNVRGKKVEKESKNPTGNMRPCNARVHYRQKSRAAKSGGNIVEKNN